MTACEKEVLLACQQRSDQIYAWCVLPNHYHILLKCESVKGVCRELGKFHGRASKRWNDEEDQRGRKVWHRCFEREIRSERHFYASLNYIHHNPVHHGYVDRWQDWPWSSAGGFVEKVGRKQAARIWHEYPVLDFGKKWDID